MLTEFEKIIVKTANIRVSNLIAPLEVGIEKPSTGIKILNKSALYVIEDAFKISYDYLPLHCYSHLKDPQKDLSGAFSKAQIKTFIAKCNTNIISGRQLLTIILNDISKNTQDVQVIEINPKTNTDIYGSYGYEEELHGTTDEERLITYFNVTS